MDRTLILLGLITLLSACKADLGDLRLVEGKNKYSGVLQINYNGTWGTVCNDTVWTWKNTDVACKQLGFLGGASTEQDKLQELQDENVVPIWMKRLNCTGNEWRLKDCSHVTGTKGCQHADDISISCIPPSVHSCVETTNNASPFVGKVEEMVNLSSANCLELCRKSGFVFASVDTSNQCACGAETEAVQKSEKVAFAECQDRMCPGEKTEACGSENRAVVYDVRPGNCGGRFTGKEGSISSPGYPKNYEAGLTCIWELELHNPDTKLSIQGISLVEGDQIKVDFPEGDDENQVIAHSEMTSFVKSTEAKKVRVTFMSSEDSSGGEGFFLLYQVDTQCKVPEVENGSLVVEPGKIYRPGHIVRMQCDSGLVYSNVTVRCDDSGMWFPVPECKEYKGGLTIEFIRTILVMVIVGLIALGILFALTTVMLICIKANDKRQSGYQGITTEIVEAPQADSIQEERYTPLTKDDIKVQLHSPDEDGEMDNNANEQHAIPAAEEDMDLESPLEEASPADETVEADESRA